MTRFERRNAGSGHRYLLDGYEIPGVTTIIGLLDKPALVGWAAEQSASYAVDNWQRLSEVPLAQRIKEIQGARFAKNRAAIVKGNRIHALAEDLQCGKDVEVPAEISSQVEAVAKFLDAWEMETIATETPVASTSYRYGGTLDTILKSPRLGMILLDWKTGKNVYDETALQLAAYQRADLMIRQEIIIGPRGGKTTKLVEAEMIQVDRCYVAHVLSDTVALHPMATDKDVYSTFLHLCEVWYLWTLRTSWKYRNEITYNPPKYDPIYPEEMPKERENE